MEDVISSSAENASVEALQRRCLIIVSLLILFNSVLSVLLMRDILHLIPVLHALGVLCTVYLAGLLISFKFPFAQLKSFITIVVLGSVILITPLAVVSHIFGNLGNYLWIAVAPIAAIIVYPDMRPGRIMVFFCAVVSLIIMLLVATDYLKPVFYDFMRPWYDKTAQHSSLSLGAKVSLVQPLVSALLVAFCMIYYMQKIAEARIYWAYNAGASIGEIKDSSKYGPIFAAIEEYFSEGYPFYDPGFTVTQLARYIGCNTMYASKAISLHTGMNFSAYVNSHRVRNAKEMLRESSKNYTLEYIFTSSGFKNQSTFNRVFKQIEGITPTEFIARKV
ncbi:MAG: helix-turn-helix transcriptional regulator [Tannerellaceae bacterium]|jgi:AraC-like DNA-binding protein|nr:helix-turn-helix transcriptional regulator [Tannerellaceae bacterium]